MRRIKFLLCMVLALCVLLPGLPASLAEEPEQEAEAANDERFADKTWDQVVEEFLQSWGTDPKSVGVGYYNTVTGEEQYLNPDEYRITASMYKVPLNMVFLDRLSKGEMDWETNVAGYNYEVALEQTIVHSNNDIARDMVKWELGKGNWQAGRRVIAEYCGLDPENVDWKFQENNYSTPRQLIYCLRLLYENPDRFPRLVETMQRAEPTEYFKRREQRFNIAHKYGFLTTEYHLYINDCGIAFTDDPILLVMFTDNVTKAYDVLTEFCTLMCDYTQYHHALRIAEEAEAERLRQEEERLEQERLEQERLVQEETQTEGQAQIEKVSASPTPSQSDAGKEDDGRSEKEQRVITQAEQKGLSRTVVIAAGGVLLALILTGVFLAALSRKYRVRRGFFSVLALLMCLGALARIFWPAYQILRNKPAGDPQETVLAVFDALEREDYQEAYGYLDGVKTLGLEYAPQREALRQLYAAMHSQFHADLYGSCNVGGERAYQQVSYRYLDVEKINAEARSRSMTIISRNASSQQVGDLYDEKGNYRAELMWDAWDQAVEELLQHPENYRRTGGAQLELRWHDGAWYIVPNEKLLQMFSGGLQLTGKGGET